MGEVVIGRPVTPSYGGIMGPLPGFEGATAAGGVRLGWTLPGTLVTSASFLEHWAQGIPARRVIQADMIATFSRSVDAHASIAYDLLGLGVMQADVQSSRPS